MSQIFGINVPKVRDSTCSPQQRGRRQGKRAGTAIARGSNSSRLVAKSHETHLQRLRCLFRDNSGDALRSLRGRFANHGTTRRSKDVRRCRNLWVDSRSRSDASADVFHQHRQIDEQGRRLGRGAGVPGVLQLSSAAVSRAPERVHGGRRAGQGAAPVAAALRHVLPAQAAPRPSPQRASPPPRSPSS